MKPNQLIRWSAYAAGDQHVRPRNGELHTMGAGSRSHDGEISNASHLACHPGA